MNPEELIAWLKAFFKVDALSPEAMKNIGNLADELNTAKEPMKQLYRGEQTADIPGRGQLFTQDLGDAAKFTQRSIRDKGEGQLNAINLTEHQAGRGNIADSKMPQLEDKYGPDYKGTVGTRSIPDSRGASPKRADNSSFVPAGLAKNKLKIFPAAVAAGAAGQGQAPVALEDLPASVVKQIQFTDEKGQPVDPFAMQAPPAGGTRPTPEGLQGPPETGYSKTGGEPELSGDGMWTSPDVWKGVAGATLNTVDAPFKAIDKAGDKYIGKIPPGRVAMPIGPTGSVSIPTNPSWSDILMLFGAGGVGKEAKAARATKMVEEADATAKVGRKLLPTSTEAPFVDQTRKGPFTMGGETSEASVRGTTPGYNWSDKAKAQLEGSGGPEIWNTDGEHSVFSGEGTERPGGKGHTDQRMSETSNGTPGVSADESTPTPTPNATGDPFSTRQRPFPDFETIPTDSSSLPWYKTPEGQKQIKDFLIMILKRGGRLGKWPAIGMGTGYAAEKALDHFVGPKP